ncbi:MAG: hypothetical protein CBC96_04150 [Pelagibacteraceae bacterium TMED136]|nr:MAG: hypothetical protein CBC96_04150 [Pelagibacteraceae bacterium TMED136]
MKCTHIKCPKCKKVFEVQTSLLPKEGREVKCGSCNNIWFYKSNNTNNELYDKYPSELPKDVEDLISDAENSN